MEFFGQRSWFKIKRSVVLVVLALCWSGCATFEQVVQQPRQPIERVVYQIPAQVVESAPPINPPQENPVPRVYPSKPRIEVPASRPPLKKVLLESLNASKFQKYTVRSGDTLMKIAHQKQVTLPMLELANQLKTSLIHVGQTLIIPAAKLRIEIDKSENKLRLFNENQLVRSYSVATGDQGATPVGSYTVANRLIQPTWYWQGVAVTPGDPDYPIGTRWLGLSKKGYGIHGTNEPDSIGKQASRGCVRMLNEEVEELFDVIAVGTPVKIID